MHDLLLKNVRPWGASPCDVAIHNGRIVSMGSDRNSQSAARTYNAYGDIMLPGLVNAHTHLDKTLWGSGWHSHRAGPTVADRIANEREVLASLNLSPHRQSETLARHLMTLGTTHIRTHVDIDPGLGLRHFHGVIATRKTLHDEMHIEIVAFPQRGIMSQPGTRRLLEQALANGADIIGGIDPMGLDRDPKGHLDTVFDLAARFRAGVDIHLHDAGEMGAIAIEMIAERTAAQSMQGNVVISHAFCLGDLPDDRRDELVSLLAKHDIAIMSHGPSGATITPPVRLLHERGVRVFSGSDGIRDAWGPLNGGDLLERAYLIAYVNGFRDDAGLELALKMVTYFGAVAMGLNHYGLNVGDQANVIIVPAQTIHEAVVTHPPRQLVVSRGRIIANADPSRLSVAEATG